MSTIYQYITWLIPILCVFLAALLGGFGYLITKIIQIFTSIKAELVMINEKLAKQNLFMKEKLHEQNMVIAEMKHREDIFSERLSALKDRVNEFEKSYDLFIDKYSDSIHWVFEHLKEIEKLLP